MNYFQLQSFLNKHCRIKLRSGKEVFGVLWEELCGNEKNLFFASKYEHQKLLKNPISKDSAKLAVQFEDILGVERIPVDSL